MRNLTLPSANANCTPTEEAAQVAELIVLLSNRTLPSGLIACALAVPAMTPVMGPLSSLLRSVVDMPVPKIIGNDSVTISVLLVPSLTETVKTMARPFI